MQACMFKRVKWTNAIVFKLYIATVHICFCRLMGAVSFSWAVYLLHNCIAFPCRRCHIGSLHTCAISTVREELQQAWTRQILVSDLELGHDWPERRWHNSFRGSKNGTTAHVLSRGDQLSSWNELCHRDGSGQSVDFLTSHMLLQFASRMRLDVNGMVLSSLYNTSMCHPHLSN